MLFFLCFVFLLLNAADSELQSTTPSPNPPAFRSPNTPTAHSQIRLQEKIISIPFLILPPFLYEQEAPCYRIPKLHNHPVAEVRGQDKVRAEREHSVPAWVSSCRAETACWWVGGTTQSDQPELCVSICEVVGSRRDCFTNHGKLCLVISIICLRLKDRYVAELHPVKTTYIYIFLNVTNCLYNSCKDNKVVQRINSIKLDRKYWLCWLCWHEYILKPLALLWSIKCSSFL